MCVACDGREPNFRINNIIEFWFRLNENFKRMNERAFFWCFILECISHKITIEYIEVFFFFTWNKASESILAKNGNV